MVELSIAVSTENDCSIVFQINNCLNLVRFLNISANILYFYDLVESKTYNNLNATVRSYTLQVYIWTLCNSIY